MCPELLINLIFQLLRQATYIRPNTCFIKGVRNTEISFGLKWASCVGLCFGGGMNLEDQFCSRHEGACLC